MGGNDEELKNALDLYFGGDVNALTDAEMHKVLVYLDNLDTSDQGTVCSKKNVKQPFATIIGEDLLACILARVPYKSHAALRATSPHFKSVLGSPSFRRERIRFREQLIFVAGGSDRHYRKECFTFTAGEWINAPALNEPCDGANLVVAEDERFMFLIGGRVGLYFATGAVRTFDVAANAWRECQPLTQARFGASAGIILPSSTSTSDEGVLCKVSTGVSDGGCSFPKAPLVVVAGGFYDEEELDSVELFDFRTGHWTLIESMPFKTSFAAAEVIDGCFFVAGGTGEAGTKLQVWCPLTRTWTLRADLPDMRQSSASFVLDGKLYLVGGISGIGPTATVIVYDPSTDKWSENWHISLPLNMRRFGCSAVGPLESGRIIVVGGGDPIFLCPDTQKWLQLPDLPIGEIQWPGLVSLSL